jgi:hypothetical protein
MDFVDKFSKNTQIPNFIKIRPVGTEQFHADRQTDTMKQTVAFHDFSNVPKNKEEK